MIGRLIEKLFVQVNVDLSQLAGQLRGAVTQNSQATTAMAKHWSSLGSYVDHYSDQLTQLNAKANATAVATGAAFSRLGAGAGAAVTPMTNFGRSAGQAQMQMMNLGYQLNDIGVTLASGMNPLTVLVQQGSQVAQIYAGQGGVGAALSDVSKTLGKIGRNLWPLAILVAGFKDLQDSINDTAEVTVSFGDTFLAVFQVLGSRLREALGDSFSALSGIIQPILSGIAKMALSELDLIVNAFRAGVAMIEAVWEGLPGALGSVMVAGANGVIGVVENMINNIKNHLNTFITALNRIISSIPEWLRPGPAGVSGEIPTIPDLSLPEVANPWAGTQGGEALGAKLDAIWADKPLSGLFDDIKDQAVSNALARTAEGIEGVGNSAGRAAEKIGEATEKLKDMVGAAADNLAGVFGESFERITDISSLTLKAFMRDLNELVVKSTSDLLQAELSGMFQRMVAGASGGAGGGLLSNVFTAIFGGGNPWKGRAVGGVEMPWKSFIAGERGQELITQDGPAGARRIMTAGRTRHLGGQSSSAAVVNMYIQTPDVQSFQQSQAQLAARMNRFLSRGGRNQ